MLTALSVLFFTSLRAQTVTSDTCEGVKNFTLVLPDTLLHQKALKHLEVGYVLFATSMATAAIAIVEPAFTSTHTTWTGWVNFKNDPFRATVFAVSCVSLVASVTYLIIGSDELRLSNKRGHRITIYTDGIKILVKF
jgi:CBS domain containing-hemolysin-like protein